MEIKMKLSSFLTLLSVCILFCLPGCSYGQDQPSTDNTVISQEDTIDWQKPRFEERRAERLRMVHNDIENYPYHPIYDEKVLNAMREVPRHLFVPNYQQGSAYRNYPLSIGHGQTISQPFIVAHMTELLEVESHHKILEIGTGSGYQAAVLSELTPYVYSIEIVKPLGEKAKKLLAELGYRTIKVKVGDGYDGWPEYAPFDGIIVTCAPEKIPAPLVEQLKPGGRIVIPVGEEGMVQHLVVVIKEEDGKLKRDRQYPVRFVPMTGKAKKEGEK
jgi:protein-L-isoaspartate(D-aspartate) O-methyltransferase